MSNRDSFLVMMLASTLAMPNLLLGIENPPDARQDPSAYH